MFYYTVSLSCAYNFFILELHNFRPKSQFLSWSDSNWMQHWIPRQFNKKKDTYFKRYLWQTALLIPLSKETKVILDRNFCRFPIIWGLELCHFLTSDQLLSQSYFLYITSASSLCFWYLRSWDSSQVANDDVCTQSSVIFSWNSLGNAMAVRNQTVVFRFGTREETHPALIWDFNIGFGSIFWLSQAQRRQVSWHAPCALITRTSLIRGKFWHWVKQITFGIR